MMFLLVPLVRNKPRHHGAQDRSRMPKAPRSAAERRRLLASSFTGPSTAIKSRIRASDCPTESESESESDSETERETELFLAPRLSQNLGDRFVELLRDPVTRNELDQRAGKRD